MAIAGRITIDPNAQQQIGQLVANIYLSNTETSPHTLLITSAEEQEGKSELSLAMGIELKAMTGEKIIVIEANLKNPTLAKLVGLDNASGLSDLIDEKLSLDDVIRSIGDNLPDIIPAGKREPTTPLPRKERLKSLLDELKGRYKYLIIESPSVNRFPDALLLTSLTDATVLVVDSSQTSRESAGLSIRKLESSGGRVIGIVLNKKEFHLPNWLYKRL